MNNAQEFIRQRAEELKKEKQNTDTNKQVALLLAKAAEILAGQPEKKEPTIQEIARSKRKNSIAGSGRFAAALATVHAENWQKTLKESGFSLASKLKTGVDIWGKPGTTTKYHIANGKFTIVKDNKVIQRETDLSALKS